MRPTPLLDPHRRRHLLLLDGTSRRRSERGRCRRPKGGAGDFASHGRSGVRLGRPSSLRRRRRRRQGVEGQQLRQEGASTAKKSRTERLSRRSREHSRWGKIDIDAAEATVTMDNRIFVATWNVGGRSPPSAMGLEDWLHAAPPADIYVLGFQEIVPLNAGNQLGTEDNGPERKWMLLIRRTLNSLPGASASGSFRTATLTGEEEEGGTSSSPPSTAALAWLLPSRHWCSAPSS